VPSLPALEVDRSCRVPVVALFLGATIWLVVSSVFGLIASIKFHSPNFLADAAWLTYGRVRPVASNTLLYGFGLQAGLAVTLWLIARLGRSRLIQPGAAFLGAKLWNIGIAAGVLGILLGDSTGFENLEMPKYAAVLMFLGYLPIGLSAVATFHRRTQHLLFPSLWFLFTALFWFPWIFSTASLLVAVSPVRGIAQAIVAWWFSNNLTEIYLVLVGLAAVFYFVPKLLKRELFSNYLALFAYWTILLFAAWGGIPASAPVPAWMPTLSTVTTVLCVIPLLAAGMNIVHTAGRVNPVVPGNPVLSFVLFGSAAFLVAGLMKIASGFLDKTGMLHFTWFTFARAELQVYGFFAMVMFGAAYYILPRLLATDFPRPRLIGLHFWLAAVGVLLICLPLAVAGVTQAANLLIPKLAFVDLTKATLPFLRASTLGDLLLLLGHLLFLVNVAGLLLRVYRQEVTEVYAEATADLFKPAEVKS
jgi:cytochrome c oxidase cbb3-type subunit I